MSNFNKGASNNSKLHTQKCYFWQIFRVEKTIALPWSVEFLYRSISSCSSKVSSNLFVYSNCLSPYIYSRLTLKISAIFFAVSISGFVLSCSHWLIEVCATLISFPNSLLVFDCSLAYPWLTVKYLCLSFLMPFLLIMVAVHNNLNSR